LARYHASSRISLRANKKHFYKITRKFDGNLRFHAESYYSHSELNPLTPRHPPHSCPPSCATTGAPPHSIVASSPLCAPRLVNYPSLPSSSFASAVAHCRPPPSTAWRPYPPPSARSPSASHLGLPRWSPSPSTSVWTELATLHWQRCHAASRCTGRRCGKGSEARIVTSVTRSVPMVIINDTIVTKRIRAFSYRYRNERRYSILQTSLPSMRS
jgi:hypothetical protein